MQLKCKFPHVYFAKNNHWQKAKPGSPIPSIQIYKNFCNRIGVSGSRSWAIDHPNLSLTYWVIPFHPFMLLGSFLKLRETIWQQLFSQFSFFSPDYFKYTIYYHSTIDLKWRTGLKCWSWTSTIKDAMCLRLGFGWYKLNVNHICKVSSRYFSPD